MNKRIVRLALVLIFMLGTYGLAYSEMQEKTFDSEPYSEYEWNNFGNPIVMSTGTHRVVTLLDCEDLVYHLGSGTSYFALNENTQIIINKQKNVRNKNRDDGGSSATFKTLHHVIVK